MMQAIKQSSLPNKPKWYYIGTTLSQSSTMAFDRLRISNSSNLQVGIIPPSTLVPTGSDYNIKEDEAGQYIFDSSNIIEQQQPFYTGGGWTGSADEHDFSFDCSSYVYGGSNFDSAAIFVKGWSLANVVWQLYAFPTGFGGTRNKNAELQTIFLETLRMNDVGSQISRLRLTNQPINMLAANTDLTTFRAKEVRLEGTDVSTVRSILKFLVRGNATGGTLSYDVADRPTDTFSRDYYDTLINRIWVITGGRPTT